ncbi:hypothetical protein GIB67_005754 [Kingdonia uniflora]|uniref:Uncharacterized protein n=1 Tax=Kingdonia uniflora TaxID=39325 RepID=A0A7J7KVM7_9MAGN|nr:hypothetical protein GIB67_005754 [Kingdonia uniflora]
MSGMKDVEDRPVIDDDLKEVEEKAKLAAPHGEEEMSKMAAHLMKGICLGVEEERADLKGKKVELERNVARLKTNLLMVGKRMEALKALQVVEINNLHTEGRTNLEEVVAKRDRLRRHLVSKGYSEDEVDAIGADTYVEEEEDEKIKDVVVGVVDGLDGVSSQTATQTAVDLAWQIKEKDAKIEKGLKELAALKTHPAKLKSQNDALMVKSREADKAHYFSLSSRIGELEGDVARIQGYVRKGVERLRESERKLDVVLSREQGLERTIRGKDILVQQKDKMLQKILDVKELNREIKVLRAQVADLEAINRAESAKANKKLEENITFIDWVDR